MLVRCGAVRVEGGNGELVGAGFQQGKPLIEAQALVTLGEIDHTVDMLLDAVSESESGSESDAIASRLMTIINDELNDESISAVRDVHFRLKRDQVVTSLSKKRSKLSDATWRKIQMDNPMQEDDGYFDPVKVSVVR